MTTPMDLERRQEIEEQLHELRRHLFAEASGEAERSAALRAERESELVEQAQEEHEARVLDRLDYRARLEIEAVDAALRRLVEGTYGACEECGEDIDPDRLVAVPMTTLCVACARAGERAAAARGAPAEASPSAQPPRAPLPEDIGRLTDAEATDLINERLRNDDRIDTDDLRAECHDGVVHLSGGLPSDAELDMARKIISDVLGFREIIDDVRIERQAWERRERTDDTHATPAAETREAEATRMGEPVETGDVVESDEEGIGWSPPDRPIRDERE